MATPRRTSRAPSVPTPAPPTEASHRDSDRATLAAAAEHFGDPSSLDLRTFAARHSDADCRKVAAGSKARKTLRAAARILGQLLPAQTGDPNRAQGLPRVSLALVTHFARLVDATLDTEETSPGSAVASASVTLARASANRIASRIEPAVQRALGHNPVWQSAYTEARDRTPSDGHDPAAARLLKLAAGITALHTLAPESAHSLVMEHITAATATTLREQARAVETAASAVNTPLAAGNDSPTLNLVEGRLLLSLGVLLRQLREARATHATRLVLRVSPTLLRQLGLSRKKAAADAGPETAL